MCWIKSFEIKDNTAGTACVFYSRFRNGIWTTPLAVTDTSYNNVPIHFPDIAGDRNGNAYITWVNKTRNKVFFATVYDADSTLVFVPIPTRNALRADVVVDNLDTVRLMWREKLPEEKNYFYSRPINSLEWTSKSIIPNVHDDSQRQPSICADGYGKVILGYRWMGGSSAERKLSYRVYNGFTREWSHQIEYFRAKDKPWGPHFFSDATGNLHAVWNEGTEPNTFICYRKPDGEIIASSSFAGGEESYPPSVVSTDSNGTFILTNTGETYSGTIPEGNVFYRHIDNQWMGKVIPVDTVSAHQTWGHMAAVGNNVLMAWVSDSTIKYSFSLRGYIPEEKPVFNIELFQGRKTFSVSDSLILNIHLYPKDFSFTSIDFYMNNKLVDKLYKKSFPYTLKNPGIGTHTLKGRIYYSDSKYSDSEILRFTVENSD